MILSRGRQLGVGCRLRVEISVTEKFNMFCEFVGAPQPVTAGAGELLF